MNTGFPPDTLASRCGTVGFSTIFGIGLFKLQTIQFIIYKVSIYQNLTKLSFVVLLIFNGYFSRGSFISTETTILNIDDVSIR